MVKRRKDQKLRLRNFDARHGRIDTGAEVKNRKGLSGVEGGKGFCYQWKENGQCSKGDQCSFRHERNDRAQTPTPKAATLSETSMTRGGSMSRKRSFSGRSNFGMVLRQPCRHFLKGICTRSPCEYWHPPECQFYKTESGCKEGDKCLFPHHKVDEQPNKKPKKYHSHKRRESDDKNAVAVVKFVPQSGLCLARLGVTGISERRRVSVKPDAKSLGTNSTSTIHAVLRYVKQVSGEMEDHLLEKYKSKFLISEVLRHEI